MGTAGTRTRFPPDPKLGLCVNCLLAFVVTAVNLVIQSLQLVTTLDQSVSVL